MSRRGSHITFQPLLLLLRLQPSCRPTFQLIPLFLHLPLMIQLFLILAVRRSHQ